MAAPVEAKQGSERADDANLDSDEPDQEGQHNVPLVQQQADVHAGARGHEEEAEQHAPERPDVCLDLRMHFFSLLRTGFLSSEDG